LEIQVSISLFSFSFFPCFSLFFKKAVFLTIFHQNAGVGKTPLLVRYYDNTYYNGGPIFTIGFEFAFFAKESLLLYPDSVDFKIKMLNIGSTPCEAPAMGYPRTAETSNHWG
jgi:hypothetical protein